MEQVADGQRMISNGVPAWARRFCCYFSVIKPPAAPVRIRVFGNDTANVIWNVTFVIVK